MSDLADMLLEAEQEAAAEAEAAGRGLAAC